MSLVTGFIILYHCTQSGGRGGEKINTSDIDRIYFFQLLESFFQRMQASESRSTKAGEITVAGATEC